MGLIKRFQRGAICPEYPFPSAGLFFWMAGSDPPDGALAMDGSAVSRSAYTRLWILAEVEIALGSEYYGIGDGVTTFQLLDMRDQFVRGSKPGRTPGSRQNATRVYQSNVISGVANGGGGFDANISADYDGSVETLNTTDGSRLNATSGTFSTTYRGVRVRVENNAFLPCISY